MSEPTPDRDAIRARWNAWYAGEATYGGAQWPDSDGDEAMARYITREDVPALLTENDDLRRAVDRERIHSDALRHGHDAMATENERLRDQVANLANGVIRLTNENCQLRKVADAAAEIVGKCQRGERPLYENILEARAALDALEADHV